MDVLSLGAIIGPIFASTLHLSLLVRNFENAPASIQRLATETELCKTIVLTIKALVYQIEADGVNKDARGIIYVSTLAKALVGFQEVLASLEQELEGLAKENIRIEDRARWVLREEEIQQHLRFLESQKVTLNITLNILHIHQARNLRSQNASLLNLMNVAAYTNNFVTSHDEMPYPVSELMVSEVESAKDIEPSSVAESESESESSTIPAELNNVHEDSLVFLNTPITTETPDSDHFETTVLASKAYQKDSSKLKSPLLNSNSTWRETFGTFSQFETIKRNLAWPRRKR